MREAHTDVRSGYHPLFINDGSYADSVACEKEMFREESSKQLDGHTIFYTDLIIHDISILHVIPMDAWGAVSF